MHTDLARPLHDHNKYVTLAKSSEVHAEVKVVIYFSICNWQTFDEKGGILSFYSGERDY